MKSLKQLLALSAVLFLTLVLAACTSDSDVQPEGEDSAEGTPAGGQDLVISEMSDIVSMDPHGNNDVPSSNVRYNLYDGLTVLNEDMEVEPGLATEWEQVDDTTWSFTLRDDVTFHDGTQFNAEAVVANLDRVLDPAMASPRMFLYEMITEVEAVDEFTVEITTEYPFAPLLAHLAHDGGGMISKDVIDADYQQALDAAGEDMTAEEYYELRDSGEAEEVQDAISSELGTYVTENPVGTGTFKLQERTPGEQVVLERNDDYYGEAATLDTVTFKVVPETASRIAEIESGTSHIAGTVESSNADRIANGAETALDETESMSLSYIGFNTEKEPLNDPKVRQAISYAIDREEIINGVYDGVGIPAKGPLAPGVFGYDENVEGISYDIEKAKELLAEAGYEDGLDLSIWTNDSPERVNTAVYLQESLQEIGINLTVEQLEWGAYLEETAAGN
ncbi:MAG TPA: ABC transporter substrate-binding protein, partial [Jeotgalicoccus aerolatus]|nr:ABC transporter substrate-binding protein [Jeotgalicoccus aerolatus]